MHAFFFMYNLIIFKDTLGTCLVPKSVPFGYLKDHSMGALAVSSLVGEQHAFIRLEKDVGKSCCAVDESKKSLLPLIFQIYVTS